MPGQRGNKGSHRARHVVTACDALGILPERESCRDFAVAVSFHLKFHVDILTRELDLDLLILKVIWVKEIQALRQAFHTFFDKHLIPPLLERPKNSCCFFTEWSFPGGQIVPTTRRSILHPSRASQMPYNAKIRFFLILWFGEFSGFGDFGLLREKNSKSMPKQWRASYEHNCFARQSGP